MAGAPAHLPLLRRGPLERSGSSQATTLSPTTSSTAFPTIIARSPSGSLSPDGWDCYGNERQAFADQVRFFNNSLLSDVRLKVGEFTFFAHRLILVRASDVFERMLASDWHDASKEVCHLLLNHPSPLPPLLRFCHIYFRNRFCDVSSS